jgi:hypothetical protein
MQHHGVEENITCWFTKYLSHRTCTVSGQKGRYHIKQGTGQGGVLSPVVRNYTMDSFLAKYNTGKITAIGYADDGALVVLSNELATAHRHMQVALRKAYSWANQTGLKFSVAKTTAVIYSEYETKLAQPLTLGDEAIVEKDEVMYLGVLLHCNLDWTPHITRKVTSAKKHLMMLRGIAGPTWVPPPHTMNWLYTCVVQPAITYGAIVWAKSTTLKSNQAKLRKAQRLGLIC